MRLTSARPQQAPGNQAAGPQGAAPCPRSRGRDRCAEPTATPTEAHASTGPSLRPSPTISDRTQRPASGAAPPPPCPPGTCGMPCVHPTASATRRRRRQVAGQQHALVTQARRARTVSCASGAACRRAPARRASGPAPACVDHRVPGVLQRRDARGLPGRDCPAASASANFGGARCTLAAAPRPVMPRPGSARKCVLAGRGSRARAAAASRRPAPAGCSEPRSSPATCASSSSVAVSPSSRSRPGALARRSGCRSCRRLPRGCGPAAPALPPRAPARRAAPGRRCRASWPAARPDPSAQGQATTSTARPVDRAC
jgi:hypothetical protein